MEADEEGQTKSSSQVNVILLLDSLGHQLALLHTELLLAAHHLTLLVFAHLHAIKSVHDTVASQDLTYKLNNK